METGPRLEEPGVKLGTLGTRHVVYPLYHGGPGSTEPESAPPGIISERSVT